MSPQLLQSRCQPASSRPKFYFKSDFLLCGLPAKEDKKKGIIAAEAVYHVQCNVNFRTNKNMPLHFRTTIHSNIETTPKAGRLINEKRQKAFLSVAQYLEGNDDEQVTLANL